MLQVETPIGSGDRGSEVWGVWLGGWEIIFGLKKMVSIKIAEELNFCNIDFIVILMITLVLMVQMRKRVGGERGGDA